MLNEKSRNLYVAGPIGFCAGVTNAIDASNDLFSYIKKRPIYFYHQIVHNDYITNQLIDRGAIFVNDVELVPDDDYVVFSAHGVGKNIEEIAIRKRLKIVDLTCPLVHKVHRQALKYAGENCEIIYIGDPDHHESKGTLNRLQSVGSKYYIVEEVADVEKLDKKELLGKKLAYVSQTTLSVSKVEQIVQFLKDLFPDIMGGNLSDICHATKNRQMALQQIIEKYPIDLILVIGSKISSNSNKLNELGINYGIKSYLIDDLNMIDKNWFNEEKVNNIALSAGASAPKILIDQVVKYFTEEMNFSYQKVDCIQENVVFHPPKIIRDLKKS